MENANKQKKTKVKPYWCMRVGAKYSNDSTSDTWNVSYLNLFLTIPFELDVYCCQPKQHVDLRFKRKKKKKCLMGINVK